MKKENSPKITQKDVAREAGVSQALVSLVLNGTASTEISSEHRRRIFEAALKLGYKKREKPVAKTQRGLFAYIYPVVTRHQKEEWLHDSYEDFYSRMRLRLEEATHAQGYALMSNAASDVELLTQWLSEWDIQGVFWNCGNQKLARWIQGRLPIVQIDRRLLDKADAVMTNQAEMVEMALKHLVAKGHRQIGFISKYPLDDFLSRQRIHAYDEFMQRAGLAVRHYSPESGPDELRKVFQLPASERPTALVAPDYHALYLQKRLLQDGFSLPADLSIVGIDNISACNFVHPGLTSIDGEYGEVAAAAVELMEARLRTPSRASRIIEISPRLVERDSVHALSQNIEKVS